MHPLRRPVWRSFDDRWRERALAHVARGGHAWIRDRDELLLPCDEDGLLSELSAWTLLDLNVQGFARTTDGAVTCALTARQRSVVRGWCERDASEPDSVREEALDCAACGACCRRNRVLLRAADLRRWVEAGRPELAGEAYVRGSGGSRRLRVLDGGDCVHLQGDLCAIYPLRPDNCRAFPPASEPCLSAREELSPRA